jgi:hypothetical protein
MTKFCTLHTPEGREHVFKIPKGTKKDYRGFYKIDSAFLAENPDKNWDYLAHDLKYRGLNSDNDFYERNGVKIKFPAYTVQHLRGPIKSKSDDWKETADSWLFIIGAESFEFYTGVGHRKDDKPKKPEIIDLFYSLTMDASAENEGFENWCDNFGYDADSRKALSIYEECQKGAKKLRKLGFKIAELQKFYEDY